MPTRLTVIFLLFICVVLGGSCGGRIPKPKTAQSITKSYFNRYGRKYKETRFADKNVGNVTINAVEEISHNNAYVDAIVEVGGSGAARTLLKMERRFPGGWRVISWEMLEER